MTRAAIVDYDLGNLPSVTKALERIGVDATIVGDAPTFSSAFVTLGRLPSS